MSVWSVSAQKEKKHFLFGGVVDMTFEDFDYVDVDYDDNTFTIYKEGHSYTYDINAEMGLYVRVMGSGEVEKYEVYSQEEEYIEPVDESRSIDEQISELWNRLQGM